eukprot:scaffold15108_cov180-Amphora_coffeaeformis.AAC.61
MFDACAQIGSSMVVRGDMDLLVDITAGQLLNGSWHKKHHHCNVWYLTWLVREQNEAWCGMVSRGMYGTWYGQKKVHSSPSSVMNGVNWFYSYFTFVLRKHRSPARRPCKFVSMSMDIAYSSMLLNSSA